MSRVPVQLPVSKLYEEHLQKKKKKGKKLKDECCFKYMKKKGKYCKSCPTLHSMCENAGRDL
ncbi:hypothetical protein [Ekhidna sp. To15]|uniref:hypothetical protein n=1 Tax=Ekhidna sp. To15 TaxID=3395267 RepID=UPI003F52712F